VSTAGTIAVYDFDMPRLAVLLLVAAAPCAAAQIPPIGIIDVYGLRAVREQRVRDSLRVVIGDSFPAAKADVERRLAMIPGVVRARISGVCCDAGKSIMFVGIEEAGSFAPRFRAAPTGSVRLADDIVQAGAALDAAINHAVLRGDAADDQSRGYSLMHDSTSRAIQQRYVGFAARDVGLLRDVLLNAADASQRALAAEVIAYGDDRRAAIRDLGGAMTDASPDVRNNAMRALALLAIYAREHRELSLSVPSAPFIDMLGSPVWTDRNKSSMALMQLTERRDPVLLAELRARALPVLVEMARWRSQAHAVASLIILGRIAGLSEDAIAAAWARGDREAVIGAAINKTPP
jgi:hypothetical protein